MEKFRLILKKIQQLEMILAVLLFGFIVTIIALQIFVRYLFGKPFPWAEELASLLLIYLTFLTADIVYKQKAHISINYFVNFFSERTKAFIAIVIYIFIGIFIVVLIPKCISLLKMQFGHFTAAVLTLPKSFWSLPVPIAFGSMLLTTVYFISEEFQKLLSK
jgi:TRAP-type C4-dicarboxylate transport system permease small subunit